MSIIVDAWYFMQALCIAMWILSYECGFTTNLVQDIFLDYIV